MDFILSDEQHALRDAVRGLLGKRYGSIEARRAATEADPGYDEKLWGELAQLGALALPFPEEIGGVGAGPVEVGVVAEEIGRVLAPEPYVEVNTSDAVRHGVRAGELARVQSTFGSMVVRVRVGLDVPRGMVFAPIHWNRAYASDARVGALTNPVVDPISGEPELKHTPVAIKPFVAEWHGVMLTRKPLPPPALEWWTKVQGEQFVRYELAGTEPREWAALARELLNVSEVEVDWMEYRDAGRKVYRAAYLVDDRLEGCVYFDSRPNLPERAWLSRLFTVNRFNAAMRGALMAGRAIEGADQGAIVCSCFGVGINPITACARELGAAATAVEIGKRLKCGTNCGSCVPEIQTIVREALRVPAGSVAS